MTRYDPQRSRPRHRAPDEGPAPVDALLGDADVDSASGRPAGRSVGLSSNGRDAGPVVVDVGTPRPAELPDTSRRVTAFRLAVAAAVMAVIIAVAALVRRRRSGD